MLQAVFGGYEHYHFLHQIERFVIAALFGGLVGAFFSDRFKQYRKIFLWIMFGLAVLAALDSVPLMALFMGFWTGAIVAWRLLRNIAAGKGKRRKATTFGSAEWADLAHLQENSLIESIEYYAAPTESVAEAQPTENYQRLYDFVWQGAKGAAGGR